MAILGVVLLVLFIVVAILLVFLVLVQNEEGDSLGGIFAGGSSSAFGSRSGNVLTRGTSILGALFLALSFSLALLNRSPSGSGVEEAARKLTTEGDQNWWQDAEAAPQGELVPTETEPVEAIPVEEPASLEGPLDEALVTEEREGSEESPE
ncbi:MAG: preprotein translocase subunit SecG [Spirochaetaceae bacterium]|jgi:preprotein translocase subunit SecG|nr:preprotein translocase subunit SecG [Spirochaetaceae bacterium]